MCLYSRGCTPTYIGVHVGVLHGVCASITVVVHPLIVGSKWVWYMVYYSDCTPTYSGVYVGMVHGVCAYTIVVVHPLIQGSMWVWYMVYVPIL